MPTFTRTVPWSIQHSTALFLISLLMSIDYHRLMAGHGWCGVMLGNARQAEYRTPLPAVVRYSTARASASSPSRHCTARLCTGPFAIYVTVLFCHPTLPIITHKKETAHVPWDRCAHTYSIQTQYQREECVNMRTPYPLNYLLLSRSAHTVV